MKADTARASRTALIIARSLAFTHGNATHRGLVPTENARLAWAALAAHNRLDALAHRALCTPGLRWTVHAAEALVLPGIQLHFAARKRFIADAVEAALADGARQVVVIGAGFDALALQLARRPERPLCIEIDHPATSAVKRTAVARLGATREATGATHEAACAATGYVRFLAADLARDLLEDVLERGGYDTTVRTCFVIEGLTMYLEPQQVSSLLATCAGLAPSGSRIVCTFMEPDDDGRIAFRRSRRGFVDAWLRARGEPFTWGISRAALPDFAHDLDLDIVELVDDVDLRRHYLTGDVANATLAAGELVCVMRIR